MNEFPHPTGPQAIDRDMVQERGEPCVLVLRCDSAHAVQRAWHAWSGAVSGAWFAGRVPVGQPLSSTASAAGCPALFGSFAGTSNGGERRSTSRPPGGPRGPPGATPRRSALRTGRCRPRARRRRLAARACGSRASAAAGCARRSFRTRYRPTAHHDRFLLLSVARFIIVVMAFVVIAVGRLRVVPRAAPRR
jgi:hypothetical protein